MIVNQTERDIRGAGLRCTPQRLAVLDALRAEQRHLRVDEVTAIVRHRLGAISGQAVYDALGALTGAGLARRLEPGASPALYEARTGDNHHHLVCRHCGSVSDVDCVVGAAPCLAPSPANGYVIDEAEITFWGTCPTCALSPTATDSSA